MKARELRELSPEELAVRIRETGRELADLKLRNRSSGTVVEKPVRIRGLRREVARMKTIAAERERLA